MAEELMTVDEGKEAVLVDGVKKGAFLDSLIRNNKQIRQDRAAAIIEDAEIIYKRRIEDIELEIKKLKRDSSNMLDLSPNNVFSLIVAEKFDSKAFTEKDIGIWVQIRNLEITLEIAKKRYEALFGGK